MHGFHYKNQILHCENVALDELAAAHGTPLYVYSGGTIADHYRRLDAALSELDHHICYAVKANSNLSILRLLAKEGSGFDIVSAGELYRVLHAGGDPGKCTFAGVGKTEEEIRYALEKGILLFNVESEPELERINRVAGALGKRAPVSVRVNPNVEADTHKYISTGKSENKFGIAFERIADVYARASSMPHLELRGVQMHIGSQITRAKPFAEAVTRMLPLVRQLQEQHAIKLFSIGGGMGIVYQSSLESGGDDWWENEGREQHPLTINAYADTVIPDLKQLGMKIIFEPGRFIVGNAGVLISRVQYVKRGGTKTFLIGDAGMNDLIRPALYQGFHEIVPVHRTTKEKETVDVVGPVCESGDFLAQDRELPVMQADDLFAVLSAGAYGFTMASNYNSRPLPAEVLVEGDEARVVRRRQTLADLIAGEE